MELCVALAVWYTNFMLACLVRWANGVKMGNYELQPTNVRTVLLLGNDFDNIQVGM